jgi:hypothetical protein
LAEMMVSLSLAAAAWARGATDSNAVLATVANRNIRTNRKEGFENTMLQACQSLG